jgi:transposase
MENYSVELLSWPAYSPDMNIIENLWAHIKDQVEKRKVSLKITMIFGKRLARLFWGNHVV